MSHRKPFAAYRLARVGTMLAKFAGAMLADLWDKLLTKPKGGEWGASPWTIVASFLACSVTLAMIDSTGCCLPRKQLKRADRIEWNVRLVSSIHAIVLVIGTLAVRPAFSPFMFPAFTFCLV